MKDNKLIAKLGKGMNDFDATHHAELFEHCVCPDNYFGVQCEHKLEICPGGDHVCLHGSQCIAHGESEDNTLHYTCDCDSAFDALDKYAGKFCQYQSTDICTYNGQPGMGRANFAFCVNNGLCRGRVYDGEDPPGCDCPEGFTGDHCEYLVDDQDIGSFSGNHGDFNGGSSLAPDPASSNEMQNKAFLKKHNLVVGLSAVVILLVAVFIGIILKTLLCPGYQDECTNDVQAALDEEESSSPTAASSKSKHSTSRFPQSFSGDSLEDVDIVDYVNNNRSVLTEKEMSNVQVV